ncbi:MAG TPA: hypothetical protein QGF58_24270 [Myxococcota bacterium]|nr:hypothetical protein [Myxococcota bacterium]
MLVGTSAATEAAGLRYVQNIVWPSDIFSFQHGVEGPLDVVVFGSSRGSFGVSPTALDACLSDTLGRQTRSVNLSRVYSTGLTWEHLARDVLVSDRVPKLLVIGVTAEALNDNNHKNFRIFALEGRVADVPEMLAEARNVRTVIGALEPVARGPETLALLLSGRFDEEQRLRWMMTHHRGGQFCFGDPTCPDQNEAFSKLSSYRWAKWSTERQGLATAGRFGDWETGEGLNHRRMLETLQWADDNGVAVLFVNMPLHPQFFRVIPGDVYSAHVQAVLEMEGAGVEVWDGNLSTWRSDKEHWLDPDHLDASGSAIFSAELCEQVAPILEGASH